MNQPETNSTMTELDAAKCYAEGWNSQDFEAFFQCLAPDAKYASQWVFEELEGKEAISEYLTGKLQSVIKSSSVVFAELGKTSQGFAGRDCVALAQENKDVVTAVVLFEVESQQIKRFDLCIPELLGVIRSGIYPGQE